MYENDKENKALKNTEFKDGERVTVTFYTHEEPLCEVTGIVKAGDYLAVEEGSIPLDLSKVYIAQAQHCPDPGNRVSSSDENEKAIQILEDAKSLVVGQAYGLHDAVERAKTALRGQNDVNEFVDDLRGRLQRYASNHGHSQVLEDVFQILYATQQSRKDPSDPFDFEHCPFEPMR